ncbi:hypothetical protein DFH11DRAFT_1849351 [Phellopilus nigrolimitatus]|nr:hypothetical protein DFH11DRAFT_1849351 [Phellopilus nigrolimitatus]
MLGLSSPSSGAGAGSKKGVRRSARRAFRAVMRSHKFRLPKYDLPLRLRPWFVLFTALIMLLLAFLGFTNFAHSLPLNDKIIHLVCLCLATTVFYFIFDVEEEARRIWIWRHSPLILTAIICFLLGGIVSEIVQSLLPHKEIHMGNIAANLIGSAIGLWTAYYLEKYYRHRREIARLYRPISLDPDALEDASFDDDEDVGGTLLLPMHRDQRNGEPGTAPKSPGKDRGGRIRLGDVWDEREELFGIGDSEDEDGDGNDGMVSRSRPGSQAGPGPAPGYPSPPPSRQENKGPKIVVTNS